MRKVHPKLWQRYYLPLALNVTALRYQGRYLAVQLLMEDHGSGVTGWRWWVCDGARVPKL